jgi:membrane protein YdbS with pleckstrin-like domain
MTGREINAHPAPRCPTSLTQKCLHRRTAETAEERTPMAIILIALVIVLILGGLGFAIHVLWWVALAALIVWLLGFVLRVGETIARPPRRRWYRW